MYIDEGVASPLDSVGRSVLLGSSNAAQVMKPYVRQVASDTRGFITQLMAFGQTLRKAEDAIKRAMESYREAAEASASKLG